MSTVILDLLLPRAVGDCNNIFDCSSFQKVRLILAKCAKDLVLSVLLKNCHDVNGNCSSTVLHSLKCKTALSPRKDRTWL